MRRHTLTRSQIIPPEKPPGARPPADDNEPPTSKRRSRLTPVQDTGAGRTYAMPTVHELLAAPAEGDSDETW